jgi:GLPGLI family protein
MKKSYSISLITLLLFLFIAPAQAQRGFIKSKIKKKVRQDMEEKYAEPEREKGKKAIEDVTYENDTRYPVPENPVQATLVMQMQSFKKNGKADEITTSKIVFGKTGECMVLNEGEKNETRMLFDYKGAATYIVNHKEKTAMKMPIINFQKMAEKMASQGGDMEDDKGQWKRTNEQKEINNYNCRKYEYTNESEKTKVDAWVTQDISIDLSGNHLFGGQIKDFSNASSSDPSKLDENYPRGLMVRSIYYKKNSNTPSTEMNITTFEKSADPSYFDLGGYEVTDLLGKL